MKNVYLVASGSYSDYTIHCVFAIQEHAEAYVAKLNELEARMDRYHTDYFVEERQFWDMVPILAIETIHVDYTKEGGQAWSYEAITTKERSDQQGQEHV